MKRWSTPGEYFAYETGYIEGKADVPERNVGEWIITEHHSNYDDWDDYTCPFCRKTFSRIYGARFCPNCGEKMKGENDEQKTVLS